ncbi:sugar-binding protein (plasmid) [Pedobacter sp. BS3]|uniref:glycoside hydrolase family 27 protein n=1 Tax=Pedobacter sp. BS3 TaxID=2567937 RepID=UPI0011ED2893|nr:glycoside hydrolase family 27 protein [Pedobacter sp. BS3]TZF86176.1 sugar-binding protein [Pedobacter sp. BS3]
MKAILTFLFAFVFTLTYAQPDNGLAKTPPMGWNSWNYFGKAGIDEKIIKEVIDAMAAHNMKQLGYEYIVVDGGWRDTVLGKNGELLVNKQKFPHGMKALADYAHSKGFKFGLHTVPGSHDCGCDKVGGWGVEEVQAKQFTDWGLDFVKLDRCRFSLDEHPDYPKKDPRWYKGWDAEGKNILTAYSKWSKLLKESGRKILFSASAYRFYDWYPQLTNMGRTTGDIKSNQTKGAVFDNPKVNSVMTVADKNNKYSQYAKPGYWNDPDMLVTGAQGLTYEEQKAHFALWCIMTSPLMLGNDPRNMTSEELSIITNKQAIAINQDPTEQGKKIKSEDNAELWAKKLKDGSYAVLLLNRDNAVAKPITLSWTDLGLTGKKQISDVYAGKKLGSFNNSFSATVNPHSGLFITVKAD